MSERLRAATTLLRRDTEQLVMSAYRLGVLAAVEEMSRVKVALTVEPDSPAQASVRRTLYEACAATLRDAEVQPEDRPSWLRQALAEEGLGC